MSPEPTPKLNLRRLEKIQSLLQYGAVLVLAVFIALIAIGLVQLSSIRNKINTAQQTLEKKQGEYNDLVKRYDQKQKEYELLGEKYEVRGKRIFDLSNEVGFVEDKESAERVEQATGVKPQIPPRLYMVIAGDDQLKRVGEIARQLQVRAYVVPRINVAKYTLPVSQLRYYQTDEAAQKEVQQKDVGDLVGYLNSRGVKVKTKELPYSRKVRPRHYEITFANNF